MAELLNLLSRIPFKDNGEPLVDLRAILKNKARFRGRRRLFLRRTAAEMLLKAASYLPPGYKLKIDSAFRDRQEQEAIWETTYEKLRRRHPRFPREKLIRMTSSLSLPTRGPILPFHLTGGAVDLALISPAGRQVEMVNRQPGAEGREQRAENWKEQTTDYPRLHKPIKKNRQILIEALTKAGFVNYPPKWWHWSYGDHLWALLKNKPYAIYGEVKEKSDAAHQPRLLG